MGEVITLERKICIESEFLNKDIKKNILNKLKESTYNECDQEYGYFIDIIKINKIKDNYISSNCENVFIVEFQAKVLKPEIGKIFEGDVCMIFSGGIFLNVKDKLKVLIPITTIKHYIFDQSQNCFIHKNSKKIIKVNDKLKVIISGSKYSKKSFSCFGKLFTEEPEEEIENNDINIDDIINKMNTKKDFRLWALKNHPDKGGNLLIFQEVSDKFDKKFEKKKKSNRI